jgi:hypothetical protein
MRSPQHAASLHCELIDTCPRRGVLIERDATDADHIDGYVERCESYDPRTGRMQEWLCIAEAEHLELIGEDDAERLRDEAKRPSRTSEAA